MDEPGFATFSAFATSAARPLFHTALLLTGDWHLAEDLVQETLAKTYRAWGGGIGAEYPLAYARATLVRTFLSHRRRRSTSEIPLATLPDAADALGDAELRRTLIDALAKLPRRDRAVIVLRYLADRSVEDVAADLGRSPGAIRVQSSRALARLREHLAAAGFNQLVP